ncbi:MAG: hypothetical protein PVF74_01815 [Anaerolineales bacterium]
MDDEPLAGVYEFVERAYVRLQAAAVLTHCMENNDSTSMRNLVEDLVFVGPQSLAALREIQAEVASRRSEIGDDKLQIFAKLVDELNRNGVHLSGKQISLSLTRLTPAGFVGLLGEHGVSDELKQLECLRIFEDYLDVLGGMERHLSLLVEIEIYLQDWLWGLIYQSTHQEGMEDSASVKRVKWLL